MTNEQRAAREVTLLLDRMRDGDEEAFEELLPLVYDELRHVAGGFLRNERPGHTLQATAVVNEAYLRLAGPAASFENRAHFFGAAARAMRRVLVDHARRHAAAKRPGVAGKVTLVDSPDPSEAEAIEILALHDALQHLEELDPRNSRVVELRYFAGLSEPEIAEVLGVSVRTVSRDWKVARQILRRWLQSSASPEAE